MSMEHSIRRLLAHEGPGREFLDRYAVTAYVALRGGPRGWRKFVASLLEFIADDRNLLAAWDHLARYGGPGAGPNGRTWSDYSREAKFEAIRALKKALLAGEYRPGLSRRQLVPKHPNSKEKRTLWIANFEDRVVARAIKHILEPLLDPKFDPHSFCRVRRGTYWAIAYAQTIVEREHRYRWITEDMKDAFDNVPRDRLLEILHKRLPNDDVRDLVERLIVAGSDLTKGVAQGSPLSSLLMNFYLDYFLDKLWRKKHPTVPLLRYVDDLLILCGEHDDVGAIYADLDQMLTSIGMSPKYGRDKAVRDVRHQKVGWLGYQLLAPQDKLEIRMAHEDERSEAGRKRLGKLYEDLVAAHSHPDAPLRAVEMFNGVIDRAGPALPFSDKRRLYNNLTSAAREAAFEEMPSFEQTLMLWQEAHERWERVTSRRVKQEIDDPHHRSNQVSWPRQHSLAMPPELTATGSWTFDEAPF